MITREQYIQLLVTQLATVTELYNNGADLYDRLIYTHRELILQFNPVITKLSRDGVEYIGCIEFSNHAELNRMQAICNGIEPYPGITKTKNIIKVEVYDEYNEFWYCLNYGEPSVFTESPAIGKLSQSKKYSPVSYEHGLRYFSEKLNDD